MLPRLISCTFILCSLVFVTHVNAATRVALVIGNSSYTEVTPLRNPQNDANALAQSLEDLDFKVVLGIDLDHRGFIKKIKEFSKVSAGADVALFFYAGHGLQVDGSNFLLPVDAAIADETDLAFEAIDLNVVLKMMEREKRINLVFLDACRDNPMSRSLSRSMGTRSSSVGRGLAQVRSGSGTLIGFATEPGNVALDGEGTVNSPFTTAFLNHIKTPGLDVAQLMRRVRVDVMEATNGRQVPWTSESLTSDFAFKTGRSIAVVPTQGPSKAETEKLAELAFWGPVKDSNNIGLFEEYLKQYPKGKFAVIARFYIKKLSNIKIAALPKQQQIVIPDRSAIARASLRECDLAAASPRDLNKPDDIPGVDFDNVDADLGILLCNKALKENPGHIRAAYQLGRSYDSASLYDQSIKSYLKSAVQGYALAQNNLGEKYANGKGVNKDFKQAVSWYRKAADQRLAIAQNNLGYMYFSGDDVTKSYIQSVAWFRKAAEQGDARGQANLGAMYQHGKGVNIDLKLAAAWYRKAADQGNVEGQYLLAMILERSTGVTKDSKQAAKLYYRALYGKMKKIIRHTSWDVSTLKQLQRLLKSSGYYTNTIDGKMSTDTKAAMKALCDCG